MPSRLADSSRDNFRLPKADHHSSETVGLPVDVDLDRALDGKSEREVEAAGDPKQLHATSASAIGLPDDHASTCSVDATSDLDFI